MSFESLKSDIILKQINDYNFGDKLVTVDEDKISVLVFQLGDLFFAFCGSQAREILPYTKITWIPGANALIPGVINVRGDVAAVLDLKSILDINEPGRGREGGFFVMVREGDGRNGILVDNIVDIIELPESENLPVLPTLDERFKRFAASQFEYRKRMVIVLDAALIIDRTRL
ncbi:hypothetical protein SRRS_01290 [Sporomusa rhizae]|uniref:chemotaxis protein CheW n=1 Tax=Sporomusa rhizae TaxID=357999 RepID=UPI00352B9B34